MDGFFDDTLGLDPLGPLPSRDPGSSMVRSR
jgi:hypothetical protein